MSQDKILNLIEKKGIIKSSDIAKDLNLNRKAVTKSLKQLIKFDEIKKVNYSSNWCYYISKEVYEILNGIHKNNC